MQYHVAIRGAQSGPYSEQEIHEMIASGRLAPDDLCWRDGWAEWQRVSAAFTGAGKGPAAPQSPAQPAPPPMPPPGARPFTVPSSETAPTSGLAIASLVLGLASFFGTIFTAVPAVICGHIARGNIKRSGGAISGAGLALAGIIIGYVTIVFFAVVFLAIVIPAVGKVKEAAGRSVDSANLRQIAQSSLIYAMDHEDRLPTAPDGWAYAAALARGGGLNDASIWVAGSDRSQQANLGAVLTPDRSGIDPAFREARLSFVVPLGGLTTEMPPTTPVAWTRGLQADGTWAKDSPYNGEGGHIAFLGGNVMFYRDLASNPLSRFDGEGYTTNILEALPPGISVSVP